MKVILLSDCCNKYLNQCRVLRRFGELVDVLSQLRFEVSRLVLVDDVPLSEFVNHFRYQGERLLSLLLVVACAELTYSVAHCYRVVAVVKPTCFILPNSLLCRCVMSHCSYTLLLVN